MSFSYLRQTLQQSHWSRINFVQLKFGEICLKQYSLEQTSGHSIREFENIIDWIGTRLTWFSSLVTIHIPSRITINCTHQIHIPYKHIVNFNDMSFRLEEKSAKEEEVINTYSSMNQQERERNSSECCHSLLDQLKFFLVFFFKRNIGRKKPVRMNMLFLSIITINRTFFHSTKIPDKSTAKSARARLLSRKRKRWAIISCWNNYHTKHTIDILNVRVLLVIVWDMRICLIPDWY